MRKSFKNDIVAVLFSLGKLFQVASSSDRVRIKRKIEGTNVKADEVMKLTSNMLHDFDFSCSSLRNFQIGH